ncbi:hypothetical protein FGO68_gene2343 [Halteria grandinella]|uniref:Uncharacterized protein n=1 Tax=Halteria grandinella TaxID=5974 RepID=A0A8J8NSZ4_HALGN|nr:hypothetical protein FGO68_gene2343 [Halteria grandinella]
MNQIEEDRRKSEMNQKRMLRDFLSMQVHEKRERQNVEKMQKVHELDCVKTQLEHHNREVQLIQAQNDFKKEYENKIKQDQSRLSQKYKTEIKDAINEENLKTETSLAFDKYKEQEYLERKERERLAGQVNQTQMIFKENEKAMQNINSRHDGTQSVHFLDNLRDKNLQNFMQMRLNRMEFQDKSAENYRKVISVERESPHSRNLSTDVIAHQQQAEIQDRATKYDIAQSQLKSKIKDDQKQWQTIFDRERQARNQAARDQFNLEKELMDRAVENYQSEVRNRQTATRRRQQEYMEQIQHQIAITNDRKLMESIKLNPKELITNKRDLMMAKKAIQQY